MIFVTSFLNFLSKQYYIFAPKTISTLLLGYCLLSANFQKFRKSIFSKIKCLCIQNKTYILLFGKYTGKSLHYFIFERGKKMTKPHILANRIQRIRETRSSTIHVDSFNTSEYVPVNVCRTVESWNFNIKGNLGFLRFTHSPNSTLVSLNQFFNSADFML